MKTEDITGALDEEAGTTREFCCFHDDCPKPWGGSYLFIAKDEDDWVPICYRCFLVEIAGVSEYEADEALANAETWHRYKERE